MLITIDKGGSINLPIRIQKELGLKNGSYLDLTVAEGGTVMLHPVSIYRNLRLNDKRLAKLQEARESGAGTLPNWLVEDMKNAKTGAEPEVS